MRQGYLISLLIMSVTACGGTPPAESVPTPLKDEQPTQAPASSDEEGKSDPPTKTGKAEGEVVDTTSQDAGSQEDGSISEEEQTALVESYQLLKEARTRNGY